MTSMLAPVIVFAYDRPVHLQRTLAALAENTLAAKSSVRIYCDGPKVGSTMEQQNRLREVRSVAKGAEGFASIVVQESKENKGLARSIVDGVTNTVQEYGTVIVLEDDMVTSKYFLQFMNDALQRYVNESKVMHIAGYLPHNMKSFDEHFFLKYMSCWGWATWKDRWVHFKDDAVHLKKEMEAKSLVHSFNLDGSAPGFFAQLEKNITGELCTWAVKWGASIYLRGGLCLFPNRSLVSNIGVDGSGTNSGKSYSNTFKTEIQDVEDIVRDFPFPIVEGEPARDRFVSYYKKLNYRHPFKRLLIKIYQKVKGL